MTFDAVILTGGKSSRMGRDKAFLECDGQPLLARQIALARTVGADKVFISGRAGADYSAFDCRVLEDRFAEAGPLAGIERALSESSSPLILVLAVDMPNMTAAFLRRLANECTETTGIVSRIEGRIEPLASIYPKASTGLIAEFLRSSATSRSARSFANRCVEGGLARFVDLPASETPILANWNSPTDLHDKVLLYMQQNLVHRK
jgi:molybdenum cofactor guanylyltransferase